MLRGHALTGPMARPRIASTLSLLVCGGGQLYNRQTRLGVLFLLTELLAVVSHWALMEMWRPLSDLARTFGVTPAAAIVTLAVLEYLLIVFVLCQVFQAFRHAGGVSDTAVRTRPIVAGFASLLIPGWGQVLNTQIGKALFFFGAFLTGLLVTAILVFSPLLTSPGGGVDPRLLGGAAGILMSALAAWVLGAYDAFVVARLRRRAGAGRA